MDLRACVESDEAAESYRRYFKAASAAEPRGGRECDFTVRGTKLDAGIVTLRSAYDGSVLAEIDGSADLMAQLAALSLARGTEAYRRVVAQRTASGLTR